MFSPHSDYLLHFRVAQDFHDCGDLSHTGGGRFIEGHGAEFEMVQSCSCVHHNWLLWIFGTYAVIKSWPERLGVNSSRSTASDPRIFATGSFILASGV